MHLKISFLIRTENKNDSRPDSVRFQAAFRSLSFESIFNLSEGSNCENNHDHVLLKPIDYYQILLQSADFISDKHSYSKHEIVNDSDATNNNQDIIEKNATAYIAGYLLNKFKGNNPCRLCWEHLTSSFQEQASNNKYVFMRHKQYSN